MFNSIRDESPWSYWHPYVHTYVMIDVALVRLEAGALILYGRRHEQTGLFCEFPNWRKLIWAVVLGVAVRLSFCHLKCHKTLLQMNLEMKIYYAHRNFVTSQGGTEQVFFIAASTFFKQFTRSRSTNWRLGLAKCSHEQVNRLQSMPRPTATWPLFLAHAELTMSRKWKRVVSGCLTWAQWSILVYLSYLE